MKNSRVTIWLVGLLSACSLPAAQENTGTAPPPIPGQTRLSAEQSWLDHGFTAAQREEIRTAFRLGIEKKFIPG